MSVDTISARGVEAPGSSIAGPSQEGRSGMRTVDLQAAMALATGLVAVVHVAR